METKYLSSGWPVCALAALVTLMFSACSPAHTGETEAQLEKRYGKPLRIDVDPGGKDIVYRWNGYEIAVAFTDAINRCETITKEQGASFSLDEIKRWLEQKGAGQKWIEEPADKDSGWEKIWLRADKKVRAGYGKKMLYFHNDAREGDVMLMPIPPS